MARHRFERIMGGVVELDLCFPCQGIWFDEFENLQITPGGVLELFELIHQHRGDARRPLVESLHCPRCDEKLMHGLDLAKFGGRFNYHRCPQKHGRFTTFGQFMIEKGFVRQLARSEILALAARVGSIHCSGCGAPVDIATTQVCTHCKAPISVLDPHAVEQALSRFRKAEVERNAPPDVGKLADALLAQARTRRRAAGEYLEQRQGEGLSAVGDLLVAGAGLILALLKS